jgi:Dehydrogenases with different specificities (related to short-chain alcohol dehydrogenases)
MDSLPSGLDSLTDRCAIITGSSSGIGGEISKCLGCRGFSIAVGYHHNQAAARKVVESITAEGGVAFAIKIDLTDERSINYAVDEVERQFGCVSVLVNNAGCSADSLVASMDSDDWESILNLNLSGVFRITRRVLPGMLKARYGRIVNISSIIAARGISGAANYAASKAGLEGFTRSLSVEVARRGITVNCVAPGIVVTDMTRNLSHLDQTIGMIPMCRAASYEDIASCVAFFADDASGYVTGQTLAVDGGLSSMAFPIL